MVEHLLQCSIAQCNVQYEANMLLTSHISGMPGNKMKAVMECSLPTCIKDMVNTARRQKTRYHHRLTDIDTVCQDKVRYDVVRQTISTQQDRDSADRTGRVSVKNSKMRTCVRYDKIKPTNHFRKNHLRNLPSDPNFKPETAPGPKPKNAPTRLSSNPGSYTSETLTVWATYVGSYTIRPRKSFRRQTRPTLQKVT